MARLRLGGLRQSAPSSESPSSHSIRNYIGISRHRTRTWAASRLLFIGLLRMQTNTSFNGLFICGGSDSAKALRPTHIDQELDKYKSGIGRGFCSNVTYYPTAQPPTKQQVVDHSYSQYRSNRCEYCNRLCGGSAPSVPNSICCASLRQSQSINATSVAIHRAQLEARSALLYLESEPWAASRL